MPSSSNPALCVPASSSDNGQEAAWRDLEKFAQWGDLPGFQKVCTFMPLPSLEASSGWTPGDYAIFHGQAKLVQWWISEHAPYYNQWHQTGIFRALQGRQGFLVGLLVSHGCSISTVDDRLRTPLHVAAWLGEVAAIRPLACAGATLSQRDDSDMTPLRWAIRGGHSEAVAQLLALGADPGLQDSMGISDAHYATMCNREDIIQLLRPYAEHRALCEAVQGREGSGGAGRRL